MAYISGATITVPEIDIAKSPAAQMSDAVNALTNAGYTVTGSLGTGTIMATKGGVSYSFVVVTSQYVTLTVDGKVVEYIAADNTFAATAASTTVEKNITGKGTGYVKSSNSTDSYAAYSTTSTAALVATGGKATVIETGYVKVTNTITATTAGDLTSGTVALVNTKAAGSDTVALYNKLGVKVTISSANIGSKDYEVVLKEDSVVLDTDNTRQGENYDVTYTFTNLTADVDASKITVNVDEVKTPVTFTAPVADSTSVSGMTFTWALDKYSAKEGETVTGTLTVTGAGTASVKLTSTSAAADWNTLDAVAGGANTDTSNTLTLTSVNYGTDSATFRFSFTVGSTTVGTLAASYT